VATAVQFFQFCIYRKTTKDDRTNAVPAAGSLKPVTKRSDCKVFSTWL